MVAEQSQEGGFLRAYLGVVAASCGVAAIATWVARALLQGGPGWALTDAVLHAVFWILLAGAAVFSAGALGFWPGPVARTRRRGLVLGGLLGFFAVIGTAVPSWFVFSPRPPHCRSRCSSCRWSGAGLSISLLWWALF